MGTQYPPKKILVVDDNRDAADLTAELLEMYGYVTVAAYGGHAGISAALIFVPDVVLLDIGMPELDGYAVAIALRNVPKLAHTVLIAYTAWNDLATQEMTIACGFDKHILKPARLEIILDNVCNLHR